MAFNPSLPATTFQGCLLYYVKGTKVVEFPNKYIELEGWASSDNQREYIKAYRDDNTRDLTLVQASGKKSALQFKIRDNLHLADVKAIRDWFLAGQSDDDIRQITIKYWDSDLLKYRDITCYQANPTFHIIRITKNDIIYKGRTVDLVEM